MSERRFWFVIDNGKLEYVQDNVTGEKITVTELEDLLNEQDKTIKNQEQRIKILQQEIQSAQQIGTLLSERLKGFCGDVV